MSIGVVSRITGISANTLRMWERRYQLGASHRSRGGQREYTQSDIDHLRLLKRLIDVGHRIGEIAKLPTNQLMALLMDIERSSVEESGNAQSAGVRPNDLSQNPYGLSRSLVAQVFGESLSHYFREHIRRYPQWQFDCCEQGLSDGLQQSIDLTGKTALLVQQNALNEQYVESLLSISHQKISVVLLYLYANQEQELRLQKAGITLLKGHIEP